MTLQPHAGPDGMTRAAGETYRSIDNLIGYTVVARDAVAGRCDDLLFDPGQRWRLTGIVVDRGLRGDPRLVPVACVASTDWHARRMHLDLSPTEIDGLPRPGPRRTVSASRRARLRAAFGWAWRWLGDRVLGAGPDPAIVRDILGTRRDRTTWRSAREVLGYAVDAAGEPYGGVEDLIASARSWTIEQLAVRGALDGESRIVGVSDVEAIRWADRTVALELDADALARQPPFSPHLPVNPELEVRTYDYRGRPTAPY